MKVTFSAGGRGDDSDDGREEGRMVTDGAVG